MSRRLLLRTFDKRVGSHHGSKDQTRFHLCVVQFAFLRRGCTERVRRSSLPRPRSASANSNRGAAIRRRVASVETQDGRYRALPVAVVLIRATE